MAGGSVDFQLSSSAIGEFNGEISLAATPTISGLSYKFDRNTITAGQSSQVTITTDSTLSAGDYLITIIANSAGVARKTNLQLNIYSRDYPASVPTNATETRGDTGSGNLAIGRNGVIHICYTDDS